MCFTILGITVCVQRPHAVPAHQPSAATIRPITADALLDEARLRGMLLQTMGRSYCR